LENRQKAVNKEHHDRTRKLDFELQGTHEDQRGPIESELNECGHGGRALAALIGRYGGASSDLCLMLGLCLMLDLVAREKARKHTATYKVGLSEARALLRQKVAHKWGYAIARGWVSLPLDRHRDFVVASSLRAEKNLLRSSLKARRSLPFWSVTITSMATQAYAPD
jgi:hypothetical protein